MKGALGKLFCTLRNKPIVLFTCLKIFSQKSNLKIFTKVQFIVQINAQMFLKLYLLNSY